MKMDRRRYHPACFQGMLLAVEVCVWWLTAYKKRPAAHKLNPFFLLNLHFPHAHFFFLFLNQLLYFLLPDLSRALPPHSSSGFIISTLSHVIYLPLISPPTFKSKSNAPCPFFQFLFLPSFRDVIWWFESTKYIFLNPVRLQRYLVYLLQEQKVEETYETAEMNRYPLLLEMS